MRTGFITREARFYSNLSICLFPSPYVFIVTGATSGIGKALAGILYGANGTVYMTGRTEAKAQAALAELKDKNPGSTGKLVSVPLDLGDLSTIKKMADEFLAKETRLYLLFNNAGIMFTPKGTPRTAQGHEIHLGTNAIGQFLFTKLLTPVLQSTAREAAAGDARVVWLSSSFASHFAPSGGIDMKNIDYKTDRLDLVKYGASKAVNTLYSAESARQYGKDGIISIASITI
ncbi:hypothetical protein DL765_008744 [Monosporascus sp. GIB2]|nr:hypothetical protein DL765_008744 [Monosporascus sp. GIB2]